MNGTLLSLTSATLKEMGSQFVHVIHSMLTSLTLIGDSLTHLVLDAVTLKIIYRSALRPRTPKDPNKSLLLLEGRKIISLTKNVLNIQPQCQMGRSQLHQTLLLSISNQGMMMVQPQASLCRIQPR